MTTPARKPALTRAPAREHPVAPPPPPSATEATPANGNETVMLSARVDAEFRRTVKRYAVEHGVSIQHVVTEALRSYLSAATDRPRLHADT